MSHYSDTLTQLGASTRLPQSPGEAVLERVPNPHPGEACLVRFTQPEFTSLCPITGQPDFAHLVIDYVPGDQHYFGRLSFWRSAISFSQ